MIFLDLSHPLISKVYLLFFAVLSLTTFSDWKSPLIHPLHDKAAGKPVFNIHLSVWTDDVSGNMSKQYNPHMNMYLSNQNIPHKYLVQEYFVRFVTTSPHASSSELFHGLQKYM